jgi:hypothetical protein
MAPYSGNVKHSEPVSAAILEHLVMERYATAGHGPDYSLLERKNHKIQPQKSLDVVALFGWSMLLLWLQPVTNSRRSAGANPPSTQRLLHDSNGTQSSKTLACCLCCSDLAACFVNIPLFFLTPVSPHLHKGCCSCSAQVRRL